MLNTLKGLNFTKGYGLLMRHADRDRIPKGELGNDIPINAKGYERSLHFGEELSSYPLWDIYASPVSRCVETGRYISEGYGKQIFIKETVVLGSPGIHICDSDAAGKLFLEVGFKEIYKRFQREEQLAGFHTPSTILESLNAFMQSRIKPNQLTLFITHDSLITLYHFALNGKVYTRDKWLGFLEGLLIPKDLKS